ncbi:flagellar protein FlaG [Iodobacter fluviatilis]|uniref:Flagellar protein FlaG n=1 Tax=Iodobacter fluviatilis TaxID=537 RepID=A0A377Q5Q0_9NEIS|nr:flagellar protein FlaG [Iodobacter fluviatilis]TCU89215.1 flagellar protein FlaG [Iodobacter fluviatilis]STQ90584.1 flagellar protein FlaG [Iodobacter fluviatilis]
MDIQSTSSLVTPAAAKSISERFHDAPPSDQAKVASAEPVKVSPDAVQALKPAPDSKDVKQAVEKLNQAVQGFSDSLQFSVEEETKLPVVKLIDTKTKEVIRQFPSEEAISIAKAIDRFQGLLIKDRA